MWVAFGWVCVFGIWVLIDVFAGFLCCGLDLRFGLVLPGDFCVVAMDLLILLMGWVCGMLVCGLI